MSGKEEPEKVEPVSAFTAGMLLGCTNVMKVCVWKLMIRG